MNSHTEETQTTIGGARAPSVPDTPYAVGTAFGGMVHQHDPELDLSRPRTEVIQLSARDAAMLSSRARAHQLTLSQYLYEVAVSELSKPLSSAGA